MRLALDPDLLAAYRAMVSGAASTVDGLARALGTDVEDARRRAGQLEDRGLVSRRVETPETLVPARPSVALGALLAERQQDLREAERLVHDLEESFRSTRPGSEALDVVDLLVGPAAVGARFLQLQRGARHEVLTLVKAPVAVVGSEANDAEDEALARGVRYRTVIETAMLEAEPRLHREIVRMVGLGERIRVASSVPVKLMVVDRSVALVPLQSEPGEVEGALLIRGGGPLGALLALFELVWDTSMEVLPEESGEEVATASAGLSSQDLEVLRLLLSGLTDDAVAKATGSSARTVQRRVRGLMDAARVTTRVQLGWVAHDRGWLTDR